LASDDPLHLSSFFIRYFEDKSAASPDNKYAAAFSSASAPTATPSPKSDEAQAKQQKDKEKDKGLAANVKCEPHAAQTNSAGGAVEGHSGQPPHADHFEYLQPAGDDVGATAASEAGASGNP